MDGAHPEWLPVDWSVCVRVRSSGKKDKYYVNPSNDLKFNSKPEVLRYLQNVVKDPKDSKLNKVDHKTTLSERLPSRGNEEIRITRQGAKTRRDLSSAGAEGQKLTDEKVNETWSESERAQSESGAVENVDPPETDAGGGIDDSTAKEGQQKTGAVQKKRKKNSKWMNGLARRASKRLARVEADPPMEVKTSKGAREAAPDEAEVSTDDTVGKSEVSGKTEVNACEATSNLVCASVDLKQEEKKEKEVDSSLNDLFMDPCIEFAIKTLSGAIPVEVSKMHEGPAASPIVQASASGCVLPLSDIWADPCFEFAVKTLTSEIPTQDESHSIPSPRANACSYYCKTCLP